MTSFFQLTASDNVRITDGTDTLDIGSDGGVNSAPVEVAVNSTVATNNTQTIYTVPAGKTAKIYSYSLNSIHLNAGSASDADITLGSDVAIKHRGYSASGGCTSQNTPINLGAKYVELSEGETVTVTSSNGQCNAYGSISYIEE